MEIYAVDFDGMLNLAEEYPKLGKPNMQLIRFLKERQQEGDKIVLWTCREGDYLKSTIKYCKNYGLTFDAINDNVPVMKRTYGNNSRKVFADHYIDDRNMDMSKLNLPRVGIAEYIMERFCEKR